MTPAEELRAAATQMREQVEWPNTDLAEVVAEWLETEAQMWERRGNSAEGHTFHALKVARAWTGGAPAPAVVKAGDPE